MIHNCLVLALCGGWISLALPGLAQPTFSMIITDQPNYESEFLAGQGLADGGVLMVGTGLMNTVNPLAPVRAVALHNFDIDGNLRWSRGYPEPQLVSDYYLQKHAVKLTLVEDQVYVLTSGASPAGSAAVPLSLRRIDTQTGVEQSKVQFQADSGTDTLGLPVAFAIINDAAIIIRDDYERYPPPVESTVQVFGLEDGLLRATLKKGRYYNENVTAWPAAGLAFISGARPFGIDARGDTTAFPMTQAQSPEDEVLSFVANGDRAVYAVSQRPWENHLFVTASTDGTTVTTAVTALPPALSEGNSYDFSAWGPDSLAVTISNQQTSRRDVHIFAMSGEWGRVLSGNRNLLWHHFLDGPKHAVIREHPEGPRQRRVMARSFWGPEPLGLLDYVTGDTLALPRPLSGPHPEYFDDLQGVTQIGSNQFLSIRSHGDGQPTWFLFNDRGDSLVVSGAASALPAEFYFPKITAFGGGRGYVVGDGSGYHYSGLVYLYDNGLKLKKSIEIAPRGYEILGLSPHPDGGIVYAIKQAGSLVLRHLSPEGELRDIAEFGPSILEFSGYWLSDFKIGPLHEIAIIIVSNLTREPIGHLIERGPSGETRLGRIAVARDLRYQVAWGPEGSLLLYNRKGKYQEFRPNPSGSLTLASSGLLLSDTAEVSEAKYLSAEELLLSYTSTAAGGPSRATLARYRLAEREVQILHESKIAWIAGELDLAQDGRVMQMIRIPHTFSAVVLSSGPVLASPEIPARTSSRLTVRSPFTNTIDFQLSGSVSTELRLEASLVDAAGRVCYRGIPDAQSLGQFRLTVPSGLASGLYTLTFAQQAVVCVKQ